ncbi:hypothetical protein P0Y35_11810 [Kiritimatiellaeota bacterium B1221]|nr:hypothetical protein [Kiritimatiellaeota bacterium B1221]
MLIIKDLNLLPLTKRTVEKLLKKTQRILTVSDVEKIILLNELAKLIKEIPKQKSKDLLAYPRYIAGEKLYPLNLGKILFLETELEQLKEQELVYTYALIYLLTLPDLSEYQKDGFDLDAFIKDVSKWSKKTKLRGEHIEPILSGFYDIDLTSIDNSEDLENTKNKEDVNKAEYGAVFALLIREYGKDIDYWLDESTERVNVLLDEWKKEQDREAEKETGSIRADVTEAKIANAEFKKLVIELETLWQNQE